MMNFFNNNNCCYFIIFTINLVAVTFLTKTNSIVVSHALEPEYYNTRSNVRRPLAEKEKIHRDLQNNNNNLEQCLRKRVKCEDVSARMTQRYERARNKNNIDEDEISEPMEQYIALTDGLSGNNIIADVYKEIRIWGNDKKDEQKEKLQGQFRIIASSLEYILENDKENNSNRHRRLKKQHTITNTTAATTTTMTTTTRMMLSVQERELQVNFAASIELFIETIIAVFGLTGYSFRLYWQITFAILKYTIDLTLGLIRKTIEVNIDFIQRVMDILSGSSSGNSTVSLCTEELLGCRFDNIMKAAYVVDRV